MSFARKPKRINPDEVDPSVYCYDEVYDDMKDEEEKERQSKEATSTSKQGSKYIQGLIETAERRNTEKELRKFKKFAREREEAQAQGELNDEEVYVTSGYKKKLEEMKALEEETRRRLKDEESSSMNFVKTDSKRLDQQVKNKQQACDKPLGQKIVDNSAVGGEEDVDKSSSIEDLPIEVQEDIPEPKPTRPKQLKTKEERLAYLEQVLAKRTVGRLFDEAVARYQVRKLQSAT